jgi:beta-glucosidase
MTARTARRIGAALVLACSLAVSVTASAPASSGQPAYRDPHKSVSVRVHDLMSRMTLEEKVGQMGQVNSWVLLGDQTNPWDWPAPLNTSIADDVFGSDEIGSILSGGGAWPPPPQYANDANGWARFTNDIQKLNLDRSRLGIPIIYGADGVHGHNNLSDATDVPHQIGLGATFDPGLVKRLGHSTGTDMRATGVHWDFAPVFDTERDLRWGRSYEPFGEDPFLNGVLGASFVRGAQGRNLAARDSVAATAKHFAGYSAPDNGHDRTDATISDQELRRIHLPPFARGIDAGVATVMVNSGSVNGEPVHASHHLLTDVLRGRLGFKGVTISDWNDIENLIVKYHVADNMEDAIAMAFNAGVDMSMIPLVPDDKYDARPNFGYFENAVAAVKDGKVPEWRIDQAVSRILTLKFKLGLFEHPYVDAGRANSVVESPAHKPLARKAAQESLVLLENHGALPLRKHSRVLVTGPAADSPTRQLGGWSVAWQGACGLNNGITVPPVTTLREGLEQAGADVSYTPGVPAEDWSQCHSAADPGDPDPDSADATAARQAAVDQAADSDAVVVAVGEKPYAEGMGDDDTPELSAAQARLIDDLKATGKPVIVVVVAGRPLVMNHQLDEADAALMAFLPGSEGGSAIASALLGKYNPSGRLTVSWPKSVDQFPLAYNEAGQPYDPRYRFGYGLSYSRFQVRGLSAPGHASGHGTLRFSVRLANRSRRAGERTLLAFVDGELAGFKRVHAGGGDKRNVRMSVDVSRVGPGWHRLRVGRQTETFRVR